MKQIEQLGSGTTFKEVSREECVKFPILVPPNKMINTWFEKAEPLFQSQFQNQKEIDRLQRLRDELLPMLLNGQVNCDLSH